MAQLERSFSTMVIGIHHQSKWRHGLSEQVRLWYYKATYYVKIIIWQNDAFKVLILRGGSVPSLTY